MNPKAKCRNKATQTVSRLLLGILVAGATQLVLAQQFVYPAAGQSSEQQHKDEYACHQWAVEQTGFDPGKPVPSTASAPSRPAGGGRVFRGATRGALAGWAIGEISDGDTGDAALAGALMGGTRSGIRANRQRQAQQQTRTQQSNKTADQYSRARAACLEAKGYTVK